MRNNQTDHGTMTFDAFQRHLTTDHRSASTGRPFGQHAAGDYPSRLRRMETLLQTPLENAPPIILRSLAEDLRQDPRVVARVSPKVMGDLARALREYADFLDDSRHGIREGPQAVVRSLESDIIIAELCDQGFVSSQTRSKKIFELTLDNLILYVRLDSYTPLIIHPVFEEFYSTLSRFQGVLHEEHLVFYHNPNLSKYPERDNGRGLIHYGIPFGFISASALRNFTTELKNAAVLPSQTASERKIIDEIQDSETESTVLAKARIGQGRFRADLLTLWQGHCALTDVSAPELLRASHIKSWRESNNRERLDAFNGLLLAVHLDALFDRALITFQDSGEMLVSKRLSAQEREVFGLTYSTRKLLLNVPHLEYMHHHQERFSSSEQKY
jgi:hypothetical protein